MNQALIKTAQDLEQKTLELIQTGNWAALDTMISPECQFVTNSGVFNKPQAMTLMQAMNLRETAIRHLQATQCGDTLIVSFELACTEMIDGRPQSKGFSPRLSVWKQLASGYQCIAFGDFNRE
jgi:hypothetical protein